MGLVLAEVKPRIGGVMGESNVFVERNLWKLLKTLFITLFSKPRKLSCLFYIHNYMYAHSKIQYIVF